MKHKKSNIRNTFKSIMTESINYLKKLFMLMYCLRREYKSAKMIVNYKSC